MDRGIAAVAAVYHPWIVPVPSCRRTRDGQPPTHTLAVRHRATPRELLAGPAVARAWIAATGLVDNAVTVDAGGLDRLRELRELIYRTADAVRQGRAPVRSDVGLLNAIAAQAPVVLAWTNGASRRSGDLEQVRSTVARDAIDLLTGRHANRVRQCDHTDCSRLFLDTSRTGARRWCDMTVCGTRVKSAAYRERNASI